MACVYLCNTTGDGLTTGTAYRASVTGPHACLMLDAAKGRALVVSPSDTLTGTGITRLISAPSWTALTDLVLTTNPTAAQRTALNAWLTGGGWTALPASAVSWWDCVHHAARQTNPAADLSLTRIG